MAESFLIRASHKIDEARQNLQLLRYAECVSDCQKCIELSIKAILLCTVGNYPRRHEFSDEEAEVLLRKIPDKLQHLEYHRLLLISKFWSGLYTIAKYGHERLGIGPEKIFKKGEAELAAKHAWECYNAASQLLNYMRYPY